ncbi:MAG: hypothetical protein ACRDYB_05525 [Acidimicrobiales bacterium]
MRVGITFELTPGAPSDLLIGSLLMNLFSELTAAGLTTDRITVTIDNYRAVDSA